MDLLLVLLKYDNIDICTFNGIHYNVYTSSTKASCDKKKSCTKNGSERLNVTYIYLFIIRFTEANTMMMQSLPFHVNFEQ